MSVSDPPIDGANLDTQSVDDAVRLLEEALVILDANNVPTELPARLNEIIEALAGRYSIRS